MSGAADEMNLNVGLYQKLLNSKHDTTLTEMIRTDLPRTFPDNIFFNSGDEYQEQLFRVLVAYGHHNKVTGYCQVTIIVFVRLLQKENVHCYFTSDS